MARHLLTVLLLSLGLAACTAPAESADTLEAEAAADVDAVAAPESVPLEYGVTVTPGPDAPQPAADALPAVPVAFEPLTYPAGDGPGAGRKIVLVAGDEEYRSEEALPQLAKILAERHGFRCTVLFSINPENGTIDPTATGNIPGLAALDDADLLVIFTRFRRLPDDAMAHIAGFVARRRPVIGIRTATHAFAYEADSASPYSKWSWDAGLDTSWPGGFGREVLGETWVAHRGDHGKESTRGVIPDAAKNHQILRGVKDIWGPTDVYALAPLPEDATVLVEGEILAGMTPESAAVTDERNAPRTPVAWIREIPLPAGGAQRIVCSTIGAAVDLKSEDLRRLLVNSCYWAVGIGQDLPDRTNVDIVGTYEPTMFGFGEWKKGLRPQDFALPVEP